MYRGHPGKMAMNWVWRDTVPSHYGVTLNKMLTIFERFVYIIIIIIFIF